MILCQTESLVAVLPRRPSDIAQATLNIARRIKRWLGT
jgi:hypothetical protein